MKSLHSPILKAPKASMPAHYLGHRQRLRQRFQETHRRGVADYELLELLLFLVVPRNDVKPLAKELLAHFGGFSALLAADELTLQQIKGVGPAISHVIKLVHTINIRAQQQELRDKIVLGNWKKVIEYCTSSMANESKEKLRLLFLDRKNRLIADEIQQVGTIDHLSLYPREVIKRALDIGACALIMVHNHPSGDPTPSQMDIEVTRQIQQIGKSLGIILHDHLVIGREGHTSLKRLGLF